MATTTPWASARGRGRYSKQTLQITIGPDRVPFHVHVAHLEATDFFDVVQYQLPASPSTPPTPRAATDDDSGRDRTLSPPGIVKTEEGVATPPGPPSLSPLDLSPLRPIHLEGGVLEPQAFEIIVNFLYNTHPEPPKNRVRCKTLLRAYVLALQYKIIPLQDMIVACFREYHREFHTVFDDLIWLVNRLGDRTDMRPLPLVKYLIDQISYEICTDGYAAFIHNNPFFETFLSRGNHPIRRYLFESVAEIYRARPAVDPAMGPHRWRVQDWRPEAPGGTRSMDVIDLDN